MIHSALHSRSALCLSYQFFAGPLAFCNKAVERVNSEKNILNKVSGVGGVEFFRISVMYIHHQIGFNGLINMMYFILNLNAYFSHN